MRIFPALILLVCLFAATASATAANARAGTTAAEIEAAARQYLAHFARVQEQEGRDVSFSLGGLDPRLNLAACEDPLSFEFVSDPETSVRNTLLVNCNGNRPWRLFLNADIEISSPAYVAATPLSRGARITESMLRKEKVIINQARGGVYHEIDALLGMEVRRPLRAGTLLSPSVLTRPEAVARGDSVKIEAQTGRIVIQASGTAVDSGRIGEQILVENRRSGRQVRGVIIAPGHVRVVM